MSRSILLLNNNCRFPFDWKNPKGFLVAFAVEYILELNMLFFSICALCFGIGFYILIAAFTNDLKNDLTSFMAYSKSKRNRIRILKQLISFIQFQSVVQRFDLGKTRFFRIEQTFRFAS